MFGRRHREYKKRRFNIVFVTFRLILSLFICGILIGGVYSAYIAFSNTRERDEIAGDFKQFSGVDPVKLSPKALISNFTSGEKLFGFVSGLLSVGSHSKNVILGRTAPESNNKGSGQARTTNSESTKSKPKPTVSFKFALIADSHSENSLLARALSQAKVENVQFIIGLGDYTEVGTVKELEDAKHEFDLAGIRYFLISGDHDLWDSRNKGQAPTANITQVFGPNFQAFAYGNARIIMMDNSDNYTGLGNSQINWLNLELEKVKEMEEINVIFAAAHEPFYHPSSTRIMGKVTPGLKDEALKVIKILKEQQVKEVFSGDTHYFTRYSEPVSGLSMTTIGAVTSQRNTQNPRFGIVTVYEDGSYKVEDVEIK